MAGEIDHDAVRESEDRSWTFALLDAVRSPVTADEDRAKAFRTLAFLEDHRSIEPLTEVVEDRGLPEAVRDRASEVLTGFDDRTTSALRRRWWASGDGPVMRHALRLMERSEADIVTTVAGDDDHPLQALALASMAFGFDEAALQPVKIRALGHRDAKVRSAAADVLLWDEPVSAEAPLVAATADCAVDVAVAAVDTLQYYPSRRVLRLLAELAESGADELRANAAESLDYNRGRFEYCATYGDRSQVALLRKWMEPVADVVRWPDEVQRPEAPAPATGRRRVVMSADALAVLLHDLDGEWAPKKQALLKLAWDAYDPTERDEMCTILLRHPEPAVRAIAAAPLAAWARTEDLLGLASDPSFSVRKSAMYHLRTVPRDPAVATFAWEYVSGATGTTGQEALDTYVAHASGPEAKARLVELARADPRESVRVTAIGCLAELGAVGELESLVSIVHEPPGVSWAVHIALIDELARLGCYAPKLDELEVVDNLDLIQSIVGLQATLAG
jgi:HEAT repeat protein